MIRLHIETLRVQDSSQGQGDIDRLRNDIERNGIRVPLQVISIPYGCLIVDGVKRFRAAVSLGLTTVPITWDGCCKVDECAGISVTVHGCCRGHDGHMPCAIQGCGTLSVDKLCSVHRQLMCAASGCNFIAFARGLCKKHAHVRILSPTSICVIFGCGLQQSSAQGYCSKHVEGFMISTTHKLEKARSLPDTSHWIKCASRVEGYPIFPGDTPIKMSPIKMSPAERGFQFCNQNGCRIWVKNSQFCKKHRVCTCIDGIACAACPRGMQRLKAKVLAEEIRSSQNRDSMANRAALMSLFVQAMLISLLVSGLFYLVLSQR